MSSSSAGDTISTPILSLDFLEPVVLDLFCYTIHIILCFHVDMISGSWQIPEILG